jgi:anti-sigma regulatory factor (Ser/Thr protein kinase)
MSEGLVLELTATRHDLAEALQTIEHHARARNVAREATARLLIVVEELFTNTIKYGYGGECARPVRLKLVCGGALALTYEDEAPEFDPTCWNREAALGAPPEHRPVGQAGIALVLGLATEVRYERAGGTNRLRLEVAA